MKIIKYLCENENFLLFKTIEKTVEQNLNYL